MSSTDQTTPPLPSRWVQRTRPRTSDWRGAFASLAIGSAADLFGLLPWIVTGMRLPLQNLWAVGVLPEEMPVAWLPFSQYSVTYVLGLLVVGSAVAGIAARALRVACRARPRSIAAGLLFVQVVATAQAANVVGAGLRAGARRASTWRRASGWRSRDRCGLLGFGAVARGPRAGAVIALTLAAIAADGGSSFLASSGRGRRCRTAYSRRSSRWVPPVLVGVAIAGGRRPHRRSYRRRRRQPAVAVGRAGPRDRASVGGGSRALLAARSSCSTTGGRSSPSAATMPELVLRADRRGRRRGGRAAMLGASACDADRREVSARVAPGTPDAARCTRR